MPRPAFQRVEAAERIVEALRVARALLERQQVVDDLVDELADSTRNCVSNSSMARTAQQRRVLNQVLGGQRLRRRRSWRRRSLAAATRCGAASVLVTKAGSDRQRQALRAQRLQETEPIHLRHVDVDDQEVEPARRAAAPAPRGRSAPPRPRSPRFPAPSGRYRRTRLASSTTKTRFLRAVSHAAPPSRASDTRSRSESAPRRTTAKCGSWTPCARGR